MPGCFTNTHKASEGTEQEGNLSKDSRQKLQSTWEHLKENNSVRKVHFLGSSLITQDGHACAQAVCPGFLKPPT